MLQKKVCMVGAFATGKTSLVSQYVKGIYSDKYQTTVGVKIDKKMVEVGHDQVNILLWDIYGEDEYQNVKISYLKGASGYILVIDGTRQETLLTALNLQERIKENIGDLPFVVVANKFDLQDEWEIDDNDLSQLTRKKWIVYRTSAKTGAGVEEVFNCLTQKMLEA
jgi:small GTP-binding protein